MLKVITVCHDKTHAQPLIDSLVKHGWDFVVIETRWKGFGTKLIETYNYLKANPEVTEFIFCDAFDVICLGGEDEFRRKLTSNFERPNIICSAEKGCWPKGELATLYRHTDSNFKYLNSGCYYAVSYYYISMIELYNPDYNWDDQLYMTERLLFDNTDISLDNYQILFNSHSFIDPTEYGYKNGRIQIMGNQPLFVHSNGRTIDLRLNHLLNNLK